LYYFCLCKSFKELFLLSLSEVVSSLAGAKVRRFFEPTKLFGENFQKHPTKISPLDLNQLAK